MENALGDNKVTPPNFNIRTVLNALTQRMERFSMAKKTPLNFLSCLELQSSGQNANKIKRFYLNS